MNVKKSSTAYDLSLFDEKKKKGKKRDNVVFLAKGKTNKNKKIRKNSLVALSVGLFLSVSAGTVGAMIYSQVQLTELTNEINIAEQQLAEAESLNTQLQMNIESRFSLNYIESYAKENLQMQKALPGNIQYVNLSKGDKADISAKSGSILEKILNLF